MSRSVGRIPSSDESKTLTKWRNSTFWVMLFGYIGYYICRKNLSAAVPLMHETFGYSNSELGLIALYSEVAYALGKFINGPLGDRIGGRKIFLTGMLGAIVCNLAFAAGDSLIYFIVVWCICRYFLSMGWGGLAKVIGNWYEPKNNGTVMGFISLNFQFGGVIATLLCGVLAYFGAGWQELFIYPPLILILVFIWSYLASRDSPQSVIPDTSFGVGDGNQQAILSLQSEDDNQVQPALGIVSQLLQLKIYRQLLVFSFFTTFLRSIFFFWTPKLLVDIGMGTSNAILKSALFPLLGGLGTILLGMYTDRYARNGDRARMIWIMLTGLIVSLAMVTWLLSLGQPEVYSNWIVMFIGLCGFFLLGPYSMSSGCLTLDIAGGRAAGSSSGLIDGLGYLGGALAVWSAGRLSDQFGWTEVFMLLVLCSILATLSAYFMSREFQRIGKKSASSQRHRLSGV